MNLRFYSIYTFTISSRMDKVLKKIEILRGSYFCSIVEQTHTWHEAKYRT